MWTHVVTAIFNSYAFTIRKKPLKKWQITAELTGAPFWLEVGYTQTLISVVLGAK